MDVHAGSSGGSQKKKGGGAVKAAKPVFCQVDQCGADLFNAGKYHRNHKVCEIHAKAYSAVVRGLNQRFCQQCSRFQALAEFDEAKRSCRRLLARHNERRRKNVTVSNGEGSSDGLTMTMLPEEYLYHFYNYQ